MSVPDLPRQEHGLALQAQLQALKPVAKASAEAQQHYGLESGLGLQIQFVGQPDVELAFESLGDARKKIELLSVYKEDSITYANIFVPDGKLAHFENYVVEYLKKKKDRNNKPLDHKALLNTIASIRAAELRALWTDDLELLPRDEGESFWWEVWLPVRSQRQTVVDDFRKLAELAGCTISGQQANFPERTVVLMYGSQQQFARSAMMLNCVAELRRAKETAEFFDCMGVGDQQEWLEALLAYAQFRRRAAMFLMSASWTLASTVAIRCCHLYLQKLICIRWSRPGGLMILQITALAWLASHHMEI